MERVELVSQSTLSWCVVASSRALVTNASNDRKIISRKEELCGDKSR